MTDGEDAPAVSLTFLAELRSGFPTRAWQSAPHPRLPILATATSDKSVSIYSLRDFRLLNIISGGHKRSVRSVAWRIDPVKNETVLATGSFDSSVGIWKPEAHSNIGLDSGSQTNNAGHAEFNGDVHADNEDIQAADPEEWQFAVLLTGHDSEVKCVAFSPSNPALLATASRDKSLWLWEAISDEDDYETIAVLTEHSGDVKCVAWHPEKETFASGSYDDTIRLWRDIEDEGDWGCVACIEGHQGTVWSLAWEPRLKDEQLDGLRLASCSHDLTVRIWSRVESEPRHARKPRALPSIIRPASSMEVWQQQSILPQVHCRSIYAIAWSSRTGLIVSCGGDGNLFVYKEIPTTTESQRRDSAEQEKKPLITSWQIIAQIEDAHGDFEINHVCWALRQDQGRRRGDEEIILSSGDDGIVRAWALPAESF